MKGEKYKERINGIHKRWRSKKIDKDERDRLIKDEHDQFLARDHKRSPKNKDIFIQVIAETKDRYAKWKDDYYCGKISRGTYLRGITGDDGTGWFDKRLVQLGLASSRWPDNIRDQWIWKAYKLEREVLPESVIDTTNDKCPPDMAIAARQTMRVVFESIDDFFRRFVSTLPDNEKIRDRSWVQVPEEGEAFNLQPSAVRVTGREKKQFERWRNET